MNSAQSIHDLSHNKHDLRHRINDSPNNKHDLRHRINDLPDSKHDLPGSKHGPPRLVGYLSDAVCSARDSNLNLSVFVGELANLVRDRPSPGSNSRDSGSYLRECNNVIGSFGLIVWLYTHRKTHPTWILCGWICNLSWASDGSWCRNATSLDCVCGDRFWS